MASNRLTESVVNVLRSNLNFSRHRAHMSRKLRIRIGSINRLLET